MSTAAAAMKRPIRSTSRTGLFIGYRVGTAIIMAGGVIAIAFGINAEGKSLETVTEPLTFVVGGDDQATSLAVLPAAFA